MDPSPPTQEAATALSTTWRPGAAWAVDGSKVSRADKAVYAGGGEHQPANTVNIVGEAVLRADVGGAGYLKLRGGWYSLVGITTDDGPEFSAGLKLFGCSLYVLESGGGLRESYFDAVLRSDAWGNCNGEPAELLDVEVYIDWGSRALWFAVDAGPWRKAPRALPAGVRAVRAWAHSSDATDVFECRAVHEVDRTGPPAARKARAPAPRPPLVGASGTPVRRRQEEDDDDEVVVMEEESEVESSQSEVESEVAVDGPEEDLESEQDAHELEQLASHFLRPHYEARAKAADEKDGGWSMGMRPRQKQARVLRLYDNRAGCRKLLATCVALRRRRSGAPSSATSRRWTSTTAPSRSRRRCAPAAASTRSRTRSTASRPRPTSRSRSTATTTTTRRRRRGEGAAVAAEAAAPGAAARRRLPGGRGRGGGARAGPRAPARSSRSSSATSGRRCSRWHASATRPASPRSSSGSCSTAAWRMG